MSWLRETEPTWFTQFCCRVLQAGPIPRHVAFIMDGNRRYARKHHLKTMVDGHTSGFETLAKTLEWCRHLGIQEVTVYAFSIENFKRSQQEVDGIMDLAREKFQKLLSEKAQIEKYGVRLRFFGNWSLLPVDIQRLMAQIELMSLKNEKAFLNVCVAYTSQDEVGRAVADVIRGVQDGLLEPNDINEQLISSCLDSRNSPDPDLLIRTSGELRLSDFLLWQCSHTSIYFDDVLWPEYSFRNLCYAILHYQRSVQKISNIKRLHLEWADEEDNCETDNYLQRQKRIKNFLEHLNTQKSDFLSSLCSRDIQRCVS